MADIEIDEETNRQLDKWVTAKRNRDFASADAIRALLEAKGIRAEQVRPHNYEPPGQGRPREDRRLGSSSGTALATTDDRDRPSYDDRQGKKSIQGFKETFGYVPPAKEQPWAASLTSNNGKIVQQEGGVIPVTGKAVDGAFRPPGMRVTGEKRTGEGGGFREFDDAEATRRKRRALEVKAETSARKAEKKKCDYWCALLPTALRSEHAGPNPPSRLPRQQAGVVHLLGLRRGTLRDAPSRYETLSRVKAAVKARVADLESTEGHGGHGRWGLLRQRTSTAERRRAAGQEPPFLPGRPPRRFARSQRRSTKGPSPRRDSRARCRDSGAGCDACAWRPSPRGTPATRRRVLETASTC